MKTFHNIFTRFDRNNLLYFCIFLIQWSLCMCDMWWLNKRSVIVVKTNSEQFESSQASVVFNYIAKGHELEWLHVFIAIVERWLQIRHKSLLHHKILAWDWWPNSISLWFPIGKTVPEKLNRNLYWLHGWLPIMTYW